jgi:hypothetical protein
MAPGLLIDGNGRAWPDDSWELARRLRRRTIAFDLPGMAVRERGFIHVQPQGNSVRVAVNPRLLARATLGGALYALTDRRPSRIMLALVGDHGWQYEMFPSLWEFAERAEDLAAGGALALRAGSLAAERNLRAISLPVFAALRPLVELWNHTRGLCHEDVATTLRHSGLINRTVIARQPAGASRLICDHFGSAIQMRRPCEALLAVGQDLEAMPDRDYGSWVVETYSAALARRRLRLESVRATLRTSAAATVNVRYDRLLMPWRDASGDMLLFCISMRRALSTVA